MEAQKVKWHSLVFGNKRALPERGQILFPLSQGWLALLLQVAIIQTEVSARQKECEDDLAKAEPLLTAATDALHTLNKVPGFVHHKTTYCLIFQQSETQTKKKKNLDMYLKEWEKEEDNVYM